ncbi:predicted protein [Lentinula edodes]|uniref:DUF6532 domain-containing protein n=1 Tax=Lentinula edodes TaxID=5353 RepID=A0A1Q3E5U8_LENED|nr:predicted protein [Lentinula edodes]
MASRMSARIRDKHTRSVVPDSLLPKSREQQAAQRKEKEDKKAAEQAAEKQKKLDSKTRVINQLNNQAEEDLSVLRPDLQLSIISQKPKEKKKSDDIEMNVSEYELTVEPAERAEASGLDSTSHTLVSKPGDDDTMSPSNKARKENDDDNSDDDEEMERLKQELKRRQEKKALKTALRREITAACIQSPKLSSTVSKRPVSVESNMEHSLANKRSKLADIGGLTPTWKSIVYAQDKPSKTAHRSSDTAANQDLELVDVGEFGQDDSDDVIEIQRAGKSHRKEQAVTPKAWDLVEVKLELVDANVIANEERVTGKPAQPPKSSRRMKTADVPFVNAGDQDVWNNHILPAIIEWSSARQNQFNVNADPEMRTEAQNQLRTYRSHVGRNAMRIITDHVVKNGNTIDERRDIVQALLRNHSFIYEKAGPTRDLSSGAWRGNLLMQAFAFYITWALSAPKAERETSLKAPNFPVGALALTAAAVKWALTLWEHGYKITDLSALVDEDQSDMSAGLLGTLPKSKKTTGKAPRNHVHSFVLTEAKWNLIFAAAEVYLYDVPNAGAGPGLKELRKDMRRVVVSPATGESSGHRREDDDDVIILSD